MKQVINHWEDNKRSLQSDIETIKRVLVELQTVGTPQVQETPDYKHLHTAIESLGALQALLENKYAQVLRIEQSK